MSSDPKAKGTKAEEFVYLRFIKELDDSSYIEKLLKDEFRDGVGIQREIIGRGKTAFNNNISGRTIQTGEMGAKYFLFQ